MQRGYTPCQKKLELSLKHPVQGLLTYYAKFLPNLSSLLSPLYHLLTKDSTWQWKDKQQQAFDKSKELLTSSQLLIHFNPALPILLSCDASNYRIEVVLAHRMPDGSECPVAYASRSLTKSEKNYSQLDKEGLSCTFRVHKFHSYLFGHSFDLITDHKPLLALLNEQLLLRHQRESADGPCFCLHMNIR